MKVIVLLLVAVFRSLEDMIVWKHHIISAHWCQVE